MAEPQVARVERRSLAIKAESTYAEDSIAGSPVTADIMEVFNVNWLGGPQNVDVPNMGGLLSNLGSVAGIRTASLSCECYLRGAGAAYDGATIFPTADRLLRLCGMSTAFHAAKAITAATNATPIVVTATGHGFQSGQQVAISGVLGNTAANGLWVIERVDANTFKLLGSAGNGAYTSGGTTSAMQVYAPRNSGFESFTAYVMQENAPTVKLLGCVGDFQLQWASGRPVTARYTITGVYQKETDTPTLVTKTVSPIPPWPVFLDGHVVLAQLGGSTAYVPIINSLQFALNNQLDVQESANSLAGILGVLMGSRRCTAQIDPEQATRAVFDYIDLWETVGARTISGFSNGAQYARMGIALPQTVIRSRPWGSRGTKATYQIALDALPLNGNDDCYLSFL